VRPEAVDDHDVVPFGKKSVDDVRPDEPGSAGDDDTHAAVWVRPSWTLSRAKRRLHGLRVIVKVLL
jgi:hypothetical protein